MIILFQVILLIAFVVGFITIGITWNRKRSNFIAFLKPDTDSIFSDYHFLHISKNGGTSIRSMGKGKYGISSHDYTIDDLDSNIFFAVIRDPIDRFISSFNFAKRGGFEPNNPNFVNHPIHKYQSLNQFLDDLKNGNPVAHKALWTLESGNPADSASVIYWPQVHWLRSGKSKNLLLFDFENLNNEFKKKFGIQLPDFNTTKKKTDTNISPENIEFLRKLYAPDFKLQEYVKEVGTMETDTYFIKTLGLPSELITPKKFLWDV